MSNKKDECTQTEPIQFGTKSNFKNVKIISEINFGYTNIIIMNNIKSRYILKKIFNILSKTKLLQIIKYNKNFQKLFKIDSTDYEKNCEIEIELKPGLNKWGKFINIPNKKDK